jgi:adenosylcobinamide-GDP ribazoletransferase
VRGVSVNGAMASLIVALRFLTVVPVPDRDSAGPGGRGGSATLVVALWKTLTGGLHLDGLADCVDGLAGRDAAHRLAIMRDSRIGVFGAMALVLAITLSFSALVDLPASVRRAALLLAPTVGRVTPILVGLCFRPATPQAGSGAAFMASLPRWASVLHLFGAIAMGVVLLGPHGLVVTTVGLAAAFAGTAILARRLGGVTGDILGAGVELTELGVLLGAAAYARLGGV